MVKPTENGNTSATSRRTAMSTVGLMMAIIGLLVTAVLRPNVPVQILGVVVALIGVGLMGYVIGIQR